MSTRARDALAASALRHGTVDIGLTSTVAAGRNIEAVMRVVPTTVLGSWATPATVGDLIAVLAEVTDALLDSMAESETLQRVLDERARDIEGLRRILGTT